MAGGAAPEGEIVHGVSFDGHGGEGSGSGGTGHIGDDVEAVVHFGDEEADPVAENLFMIVAILLLVV